MVKDFLKMHNETPKLNNKSAINLKQNKLLFVWIIISAVFLIIVFAASIILPLTDNLVTSANFMMNTVVTQNIYDKNGEVAKNEVISALSQFDKDFSMHIDTSYISKINQNAGIAPVEVSDEVFSDRKGAAALPHRTVHNPHYRRAVQDARGSVAPGAGRMHPYEIHCSRISLPECGRASSFLQYRDRRSPPEGVPFRKAVGQWCQRVHS